MRISDWSSDVCSSDLRMMQSRLLLPRCADPRLGCAAIDQPFVGLRGQQRQDCALLFAQIARGVGHAALRRGIIGDRKSVVEGKSVSVRVDLGGRSIIKKKNKTTSMTD